MGENPNTVNNESAPIVEKEASSKNLSVFSDVIMSIAQDAAADVKGVQVLRGKKGRKAGAGVSVYFLPNDKVSIDLFVNIMQGYTIPSAIAEVQENVIKEVQTATKYRVHSVNVQVVSVVFS